jgi:hypothetical protein
MLQRRFPRPWRFEPIPGGYRVIDANGLGLAHVDGEPRTPAPSRTSGYQNCRPERHLYLNPEILRLPKRMPVLEIARHLVCSKCGAIGDGFVHIRASMWSC